MIIYIGRMTQIETTFIISCSVYSLSKWHFAACSDLALLGPAKHQQRTHRQTTNTQTKQLMDSTIQEAGSVQRWDLLTYSAVSSRWRDISPLLGTTAKDPWAGAFTVRKFMFWSFKSSVSCEHCKLSSGENCFDCIQKVWYIHKKNSSFSEMVL